MGKTISLRYIKKIFSVRYKIKSYINDKIIYKIKDKVWSYFGKTKYTPLSLPKFDLFLKLFIAHESYKHSGQILYNLLFTGLDWHNLMLTSYLKTYKKILLTIM